MKEKTIRTLLKVSVLDCRNGYFSPRFKSRNMQTFNFDIKFNIILFSGGIPEVTLLKTAMGSC